MRLTELLKEGMYDRLVGQINKDVFKTIKAAMVGSGTQEKPKKFKGYEVRKDPIPTTKIGDMLNAEKRYLYVGEYNDDVSGVDVEVELKFAVTEDGVEKGKFYIDGNILICPADIGVNIHYIQFVFVYMQIFKSFVWLNLRF